MWDFGHSGLLGPKNLPFWLYLLLGSLVFSAVNIGKLGPISRLLVKMVNLYDLAIFFVAKVQNRFLCTFSSFKNVLRSVIFRFFVVCSKIGLVTPPKKFFSVWRPFGALEMRSDKENVNHYQRKNHSLRLWLNSVINIPS